jgi:hypothetical protein
MTTTATATTSVKKYPFVSVCTPTYNRRPFIPLAIECFNHQTYPKDKMEWIIVDDGTDPIGDLVENIPQVKYFRINEKMSLGRKRNYMNQKCKGSIIVYMDDDDYYPPERVSHAVEMLQLNPNVEVAGSSLMYFYFPHLNQIITVGPYGDRHATAATFAFRKTLLKQTMYDTTLALSEEKQFLKDYTFPMVQLDPTKTILVLSHSQNTFDKRGWIDEQNNPTNPNVHVTEHTLETFGVNNTTILNFIRDIMPNISENYLEGERKMKEDVVQQLEQKKYTKLVNMNRALIEENKKLNQMLEKYIRQYGQMK